MKWKGKIIECLLRELMNDCDWGNEYIQLLKSDSGIGLHLAVFSEPYLTLLLDGRKTIESRFSINNVCPFGRVSEGDIILAKKPGGLISAGFIAKEVKYYNRLNLKKLMELDELYGKAICSDVDPDFWKLRMQVKYGTLIRVGRIKNFTPFESNKSDRTAWTVLRTKSKTLFDL